MRIKVYIVTYRNDNVLNQCLCHLYESDAVNYDLSTHIVNNYGILRDINIDNEKIYVINNQTRPDWSHGHLGRNWNECLIDGFRDLNNPDCDLVVLVQNDTVIQKDCFSKLIEHHKDYDFIQAGVGDQFMSFTPQAVKMIGIFDERFCRVNQETDYFKAAVSFFGERSSLNDAHHLRINNPIDDFSREVNATWKRRTGFNGAGCKFVEFAFSHCWDYAPKIIEGDKLVTVPTNQIWNTGDCTQYMGELFKLKWGCSTNTDISKATPLIQRYFTYPYFEKDIETLKEQNYLFSDTDLILDFRKKFGTENESFFNPYSDEDQKDKTVDPYTMMGVNK